MFNSLFKRTGKVQISTLKGAPDGSSSASMMVAREFNVTEANDAAKKPFNDAIDDFRQAFPKFDPKRIVGTCIDIFHRNPAHQRQMLANPANLPFRTDIRVGRLTITLNVTASYDGRGRYIGNVLEWRDVTEVRQHEAQDADFAAQIAASSSSQSVVQFTASGEITCANANVLQATGYRLDEIVGQHHSLFVAPEVKANPEYRAFWEKLG